MAELEKVIKGLEQCVGYEDADNEYSCIYDGDTNPNCPYAGTGVNGVSCMTKLMRDALALLKAQEPRVERQGRWERVGSDGIVCCSVCGVPMGKTRVCFPDGESGYYYIATKYCPHCGVRNEKGDCDG